MERLLLVPVDDSVVFPHMTVTLAVDVGEESGVVLVPRADDAFATVGTVAEVVDRVRLPGGGDRARGSPPGHDRRRSHGLDGRPAGRGQPPSRRRAGRWPDARARAR